MEKKVLEAVKACFDANESAKEFHVTSDGQCFHNENAAIAHSKSLENRDVEKVNRKDVEVVAKAAKNVEEIVKNAKKVDETKSTKKAVDTKATETEASEKKDETNPAE